MRFRSIYTRFFFVFAVLSATCAVFGSVQVTALYTVEQGNVVLTSRLPSPLVGGGVGVRGKITNQYIYSPYGIQKKLTFPHVKLPSPLAGEGLGVRGILNLNQNQFSYTDQQQDPSTGLIMLGHFRNYAPGIGRFIQPDTYNSFSKRKVNNAFAYGLGNPMLHVDPTGHFNLVALGEVALLFTGAGGLLSIARGGYGLYEAVDAGDEVLGLKNAFNLSDFISGISSDISVGLDVASNDFAYAGEEKQARQSYNAYMGLGLIDSVLAIPSALTAKSIATKALSWMGIAMGGTFSAIGLYNENGPHNHNQANLDSDLSFMSYIFPLVAAVGDAVWPAEMAAGDKAISVADQQAMLPEIEPGDIPIG